MIKPRMNVKKASAITAAVAMVLSGSGGLGALASASPMSQVPQATKSYHADLQPLNNSGVHGTADLTLTGNKLTVSMKSSGLMPNQNHDQHIHGMLTAADASCPTMAQDTNHDGYVSVVEGAASYGPIKVNLTSPQTKFGPNDTKVMGVPVFAPFAGVPNDAGFPTADAQGNETFNQTYRFNMHNPAAVAAYNSVATQLANQTIVLHGMDAPAAVDGSMTPYDDLLPVACGEITAVSSGTGASGLVQKLNDSFGNANAAFQTNLNQNIQTTAAMMPGGSQDSLNAFNTSAGVSYATLQASLTQAENQYVANANNGGDAARNMFIDQFNNAKATYFNNLEQAKNMLSDALNQAGQAPAKDQFMNNFNASEGTYGNQLEQVKAGIQ